MSHRVSKSIKNEKLIFVVFMMLQFFFRSSVFGDGVSPAYLEITEQEDCRIEVTWKVPIVNGALLAIEPVFSDDYKQVSPRTRIETKDAVIRRWALGGEGIELAGKEIRIKNLDSTVTEVLVRVKLKDSSIHRLVLRPSEPLMVVPLAEKMSRTEVFKGILVKVDEVRFLILCSMGVVLSLFGKARKRGFVLCITALLAGAMLGHTLGSIAGDEKFFNGGIPSNEENRRILHGLLLNTYRSSLYEDEEVVYDQLAKSVTGDLLSTVYLQNRDALNIDEAEGAKSIIDRVDVRSVESTQPMEGGAFSVLAGWDVYGSVRHWEHTHYRCNSYKAKLTIVPDDDYWKISNIEIIDEERVI
ncbi:MAG: hypothetical protein ACYTE8_05940 [Planctomycetota bacterium]|jgi:hypothetical protein